MLRNLDTGERLLFFLILLFAFIAGAIVGARYDILWVFMLPIFFLLSGLVGLYFILKDRSNGG